MQPKLIFLNVFAFLSLLIVSCQEKKSLPFLGPKETRVVEGKVDTIYHQIPAFRFLNQDSVWVSEQDMAGKIYIADFFFTSCPTICPKMKTQLLRIYERYASNDAIRILSHSIDPTFDTPSVLKQYAERLHVKAPRWNMLTGDKAAIYKLGEKSYMVTAQEDKNEAGGFVHSGAFILVDKNRHVRGIYDGTQEAEVNHLIEDIEMLLQEK
jgi:protein SCO1/2